MTKKKSETRPEENEEPVDEVLDSAETEGEGAPGDDYAADEQIAAAVEMINNAKRPYIYIGGGSLTIQAGDDGIHANSVAQIDGGALTIRAAEGIEGTCVQINGGVISIQAGDDGINAARKSSAYNAVIIINGGDITVAMGAGDTDGIDSNGNIIVNGGTIRVTGNSTFDYDGSAQYNGGVIIANGQQVSTIPNQMMGGRGNWNKGNGGKGGRGGW